MSASSFQDKRVCSDSPMHIILIADDSVSMRQEQRAQQVNSGIQRWLNELLFLSSEGQKYWFYFSYITFGTKPKVWDTNVPLPELIIENLEPISGKLGGTNMAPAIERAIAVLQAHPPKASDCPPFVYLYTDGEADDPVRSLEVAEKLKSMPLPCGPPRLVVLGFDAADTPFCRKLASFPEFYLRCNDSETLANLLPEIGSLVAKHSLQEAEAGIRQQVQEVASVSKPSSW